MPQGSFFAAPCRKPKPKLEICARHLVYAAGQHRRACMKAAGRRGAQTGKEASGETIAERSTCLI
jgi:hypothetical protein